MEMNFKFKIAFGIYAFNIVVMVCTGFIYGFSNEFMPFHSDVIRTQWVNVDHLSQILYLGMMRTESAGFLAAGTAILILLFIPFLKFERWSYWAMTIVGLVEYIPTLFATHHVSSVTAASPPWIFILGLSVSLVIALCLAESGNKQGNK
jgi:hypothetical protein